MGISPKKTLQGFSVATLALVITACGGGSDDSTPATTTPTTPSFKLTSTAFVEGGKIPLESACVSNPSVPATVGQNRSVPLAWSEVPVNTSKYAVIMDDETAPHCPTGDSACKHWAVYNIPSSMTTFTTGQKVTDISGVTEGKVYDDTTGYAGMCPPSKHTYKITAYALKDTMPDITSGTPLTRSQFKTQYSSYILGEATLSGTFDPTAP
jgi:Raf kinase inhibitor-like YbhB/YbcL family protein